ncbi:hypothetical protein PRK78_002891 [Emydomyces testavorans]|uniref:Sister chromatid cohesion protein Dcc1 n=1 Tax=Emydomyces testavorans TaxID=2070801 RepID=A0AAF0DFY4_9EURO|nr:hypothetical protein PRK78_002891 [Emydomyces testavorans]
MSSGIRFTHTVPQHAVRLVELPEELLELITSKDAPTYGSFFLFPFPLHHPCRLQSSTSTDWTSDDHPFCRPGRLSKGSRTALLTFETVKSRLFRLYLKSSPPLPSGVPAGSDSLLNQGIDEAFVNLCTDTETYLLRQVHSSNSIFVLKPTLFLQNDGEKDETLAKGTTDAVTAIALCKSTLELQKIRDGPSALPYLLRSLQVYGTLDLEEDALDTDKIAQIGQDPPIGSMERHKVLARLFADIPFSALECHQVWVDMCGFVHEDRKLGILSVRRPSAAAKLSVWKKLLEGSVLQGINLEQQFLVRDLWTSMLDDTEKPEEHALLPRGLFDSVVRRLMDDSPPGVKLQVFSELKWANLDKSTTINWVGNVYLEAMAPTPKFAISRNEFLAAWRDLTPEKWRVDVTVVGLEDISCQRITPSRICFNPNMEEQNHNKTVRGKRGR